MHIPLRFPLPVFFAGFIAFRHATASPDIAATTCSDIGIAAAAASRVSSAFQKAKLSPQVVPNFAPQVQLRATYGAKQVDLGNKFSVLETMSEPTINFSAEKDFDPATTKYTILFIDPDAPSPTAGGEPGTLSPILHMAVNDASPYCINPANKGGGTTTASYLTPVPFSTAPHRYTLLLYRQPPNFKPPFSVNVLARVKFDIKTYTKDLTLVAENGCPLNDGGKPQPGIKCIT